MDQVLRGLTYAYNYIDDLLKTFQQLMGIPHCIGTEADRQYAFLCGLQEVKQSNKKDAYPLPRVDDALDTLSRCQ